jgi:tetratricopeptide (TPR) repeat protein
MLGYQQALELAPTDSAAARALARCRASSDRRAARSAELRRQFQAALDALTGEDLPTARRGFHEIVGTNPRDIEAQAMLRRVDQAIERRAAGSLADAIRLTRSGLLDEAQRAIDQARALEPELAGLPAAVAALTRAREARSGSDTAKTTPRPDTTADSVVVLTPEQRREVDELYRRGLDAAKRGHEDQAVNYWELVWEKYPSYPRVVEDLKRVYLNRGLDAFAAGQLGEAVRQWERALRIDPADARTRAYLTRAQAYLSRVQEIGAR